MGWINKNRDDSAELHPNEEITREEITLLNVPRAWVKSLLNKLTESNIKLKYEGGYKIGLLDWLFGVYISFQLIYGYVERDDEMMMVMR